MIDYTGPRVAGEIGLAFPMGTGGLAEIAGIGLGRFLSRSEGGSGVDYDVVNFSFGMRYSAVL